MTYLVFLIALSNGLLMESVAYKNNFWRYKKPTYLGFNILVVFTVIQGGIAFWGVSGPDGFSLFRLVVCMLLGSAFGIAYEAFNQFHTRLFDFGENGVIFLKTKTQLIWGVGIAWGGGSRFVLPCLLVVNTVSFLLIALA